jgi:uncharacterized iron-regulated protein
MTRQVLLLGVLLLGACGGRYHAAAEPAHPSDAGPRGIEAAALPYRIVDGHSGREVDAAAFWAALGSTRAVCVGEDHPNPHHHWAQLEIVDHLVAHHAGALGLGLEMVQLPFQGPLDDFAAGTIDEPAMLQRVGWDDRWGYAYKLYRPIVAHALAGKAALLALNASRELSAQVSSRGVDGLSTADKARLPELVLDDAVHRAWFDGVMADMGGHHHGDDGDESAADPAADRAAADRTYSVQVLWDETMADTAARWLGGGDRSLVILAGTGHCHDSAIVGRMRRRGVTGAVSVRPILDTDGEVADALANPMNDYLFVMSVPAQ